MASTSPRDLVGYGRAWPHPQWPGGARIAVQFVLNHEEGAERIILLGDPESESLLNEFGWAVPRVGERSLPIESMYEFGSRVGFWRIHRLFTERGVPVTVNAVAKALELNPEATAAMLEADWELSSHGYRWVDYHGMPVAEERGFLYTQDSYADEVPYWIEEAGRPLLVVPYTADVNDHRFATSPGFDWGAPFFEYLRDAFDVLYEEGDQCPRMMQVALHNRLVGRPGRFGHLRKFVDYVLAHDRVWLCRGIDVARHWMARFPAPGP